MKLFMLFVSLCFAGTALAEASDKALLLDGTNHILLKGEIDGQTVAKASEALLTIDSKDVYLVIDSPGGSVIDGLQLIDTIKASGKRVHCIAIFAASMAFDILQSCDTRMVQKSSILMQHVPSYGTGRGGAEPNQWSFAKFMRELHMKLIADESKRIGLSAAEFAAKTRDDWWLLGEQAVKENVADRLAVATCTPELTKKRRTEVMNLIILTVNVEFSQCPLLTGPLKVEMAKNFLNFTKEEYVAEMNKVIDKLNLLNWTKLTRSGDIQKASERIKQINR